MGGNPHHRKDSHRTHDHPSFGNELRRPAQPPRGRVVECRSLKISARLPLMQPQLHQSQHPAEDSSRPHDERRREHPRLPRLRHGRVRPVAKQRCSPELRDVLTAVLKIISLSLVPALALPTKWLARFQVQISFWRGALFSREQNLTRWSCMLDSALR